MTYIPKRVNERTRILVGNCVDVLAEMASLGYGPFELIFADPPFNIGRKYDTWDDRMPLDQYAGFTYDWMLRCASLLAPRGSLWVNVPDSCIPAVLEAAKSLANIRLHQWCIWHYRFGQHTKYRFVNSKTHALWFASGKPKFNADAIRVQSLRQHIGDKRADARGRVPMDVWGFEEFWGRVQGNNKERQPLHDNQLPEVYLERIIRACTDVGDRVLDPFMGSGTTLVVANALGRSSWGIEISKKYAASAMKRIRQGSVRVKDVPTTSSRRRTRRGKKR